MLGPASRQALFGVFVALFATGCSLHQPSPLVRAARAGDLVALKAEIDRGTLLDAPEGINGWTPLMHAVHKHQVESVKLLLESGARADAQNSLALVMAAGYGDAASVRLLLDHGADPHVTLADGRSPLSEAIAGASDIDYQWSGCPPHEKTVETLLEAAPELKLPSGALARSAYASAERHGCRAILARVAAPAQ